MAKEKVFITVKTYPTLSRKYGELVCTAGFREDGSWVRIYPVPYRTGLDFDSQYKKYQWISLELERNMSDFRPETYRPSNVDDISLLEVVGTKDCWRERKSLIFKGNKVYENLTELISLSKTENISLAIFKPKKILNFHVEQASAMWDLNKLKEITNQSKQLNFLNGPEKIFKIVPKIPFKFSYSFLDIEGRKSKLMIEDWETGQLYLNCLAKYSPEEAVKKVREKYFTEFLSKKELYLFLGTTLEHHTKRAPNPFVITGIFYPPIEREPFLF